MIHNQLSYAMPFPSMLSHGRNDRERAELFPGLERYMAQSHPPDRNVLGRLIVHLELPPIPRYRIQRFQRRITRRLSYFPIGIPNKDKSPFRDIGPK